MSSGSLDLHVHPGQAQAALLERLQLLVGPLDLRVDQGREGILAIGLVDEHAVQHAELRGGETDAERVVHQFAHALYLLGQGLVEALHRQGRGAQDGSPNLRT